MGLADLLAEEADHLGELAWYQRCGVGQLWDLLEEEDRAAVASLFDNKKVPGTRIMSFFKLYAEKLGSNPKISDHDKEVMEICSNISSGTIQRHRRGACKCGDLW